MFEQPSMPLGLLFLLMPISGTRNAAMELVPTQGPLWNQDTKTCLEVVSLDNNGQSETTGKIFSSQGHAKSSGCSHSFTMNLTAFDHLQFRISAGAGHAFAVNISDGRSRSYSPGLEIEFKTVVPCTEASFKPQERRGHTFMPSVVYAPGSPDAVLESSYISEASFLRIGWCDDCGGCAIVSKLYFQATQAGALDDVRFTSLEWTVPYDHSQAIEGAHNYEVDAWIRGAFVVGETSRSSRRMSTMYSVSFGIAFTYCGGLDHVELEERILANLLSSIGLVEGLTTVTLLPISIASPDAYPPPPTPSPTGSTGTLENPPLPPPQRIMTGWGTSQVASVPPAPPAPATMDLADLEAQFCEAHSQSQSLRLAAPFAPEDVQTSCTVLGEEIAKGLGHIASLYRGCDVTSVEFVKERTQEAACVTLLSAFDEVVKRLDACNTNPCGGRRLAAGKCTHLSSPLAPVPAASPVISTIRTDRVCTPMEATIEAHFWGPDFLDECAFASVETNLRVRLFDPSMQSDVYIELAKPPPPPPRDEQASDSLSDRAISGIAIGTFLALLIVVTAGFVWHHTGRGRTKQRNTETPSVVEVTSTGNLNEEKV